MVNINTPAMKGMQGEEASELTRSVMTDWVQCNKMMGTMLLAIAGCVALSGVGV